MMKANKIAWLTALTILAGCADAGTDNEPGDELSPDFRDGSYHYVFGYDPETGEQIRGGAHMVLTFDEEGKTEAIDSANRTSRFHPSLTTGSEYARFDASLTEGETDWDVFASTWWPQSKNGTAWRWQPGANQDYADLSDVDTLSPMEKYDLLFYPGQGDTVPATENCTYADYAEDRDNCEKTSHPELTVAGPATKWEIENQGQYQWVQPENWWGHCNGWASYATAEPMGYPHRDVRVKLVDDKVTECVEGDDDASCVLWKMADVEGLFTELHFSDQATFTGRRCRTAADEIERDEFGRPTDVSCRDLNPGSFHIAITGLLGRGTRNLTTNEDGRPPFVVDHTADYEVWNFPVTAFTADYETVTAEQANELIGANGSDYVFNDDAVSFQRVALTYTMISDAVPENELLKRADTRNVDPHLVELNYVLELDEGGRIIGGEWIKDPVTTGPNNQELHPDFAWMAVGAIGYGEGSDDTGGDNDNPYIALSKARALLQCANEPESCAPEGRDGELEPLLDVTEMVAEDETRTYATEELPAGEFTVTLAHTEANPGGDADLYVRVGEGPTMEEYDCRPWETGSDEVCVVNLTEASRIDIMVHGYPGEGDSHFRLTVTGDVGEPEPEVWGGLNESGTVVAGEEVRFTTPSLPVGSYLFDMKGDEDADLYVAVGSEPTTSVYECRPYLNGSEEQCTVTLSEPAEIHVMVRGYADRSNWQLTGAAQ